eukprot:4588795-Prorocentrum_lima.AAC.1
MEGRETEEATAQSTRKARGASLAGACDNGLTDNGLIDNGLIPHEQAEPRADGKRGAAHCSFTWRGTEVHMNPLAVKFSATDCA